MTVLLRASERADAGVGRRGRRFESARAALANLDLDRCLAFASDALLDLADDWRPEGAPRLDVAAFRARMVPDLVSIEVGGGVALGVDVDDVLGDHAIEVTLDDASEPVGARMY